MREREKQKKDREKQRKKEKTQQVLAFSIFPPGFLFCCCCLFAFELVVLFFRAVGEFIKKAVSCTRGGSRTADSLSRTWRRL